MVFQLTSGTCHAFGIFIRDIISTGNIQFGHHIHSRHPSSIWGRPSLLSTWDDPRLTSIPQKNVHVPDRYPKGYVRIREGYPTLLKPVKNRSNPHKRAIVTGRTSPRVRYTNRSLELRVVHRFGALHYQQFQRNNHVSPNETLIVYRHFSIR